MRKLLPLSLILLSACSLLYAETSSLSKVIRKIETRRGFWIHMQASLNMNFTTPQGKKASCRAELSYNRLDEKILLKGFNDKEEPLFVFRTDDRNFDLYLPRQNTVFSGTIFDLEDSPEIHSHLKALDLYRSLKPAVIPSERTEIIEETGILTHLKIQGNAGPVRSVYADPEGDTLKEVYYRKDGKPKTLIERSGFETIQKSAGELFSFPKKIRIESYSENGVNETDLAFQTVRFSASSGQRDFDLELPEGVRRADIGEEFRKQQALVD